MWTTRMAIGGLGRWGKVASMLSGRIRSGHTDEVIRPPAPRVRFGWGGARKMMVGGTTLVVHQRTDYKHYGVTHNMEETEMERMESALAKKKEEIAAANKAIVADGNIDVTAIRNLTLTGNIQIGGDMTVSGTTTSVNTTNLEKLNF